MNTQLKSLTLKYFWQQKVQEIYAFIIIVAVVIIFPWSLGNMIGDGYDVMCGEYNDVIEGCSTLLTWVEGIFHLMMVWILSLFLWLFIWPWIENNWERASMRAEEELLNTKNRRKKTNGK